jgi:adenosine kinase
MEGASRVDIAKCLAGWKKANDKRPRIVILTQGPLPVIVATSTVGSTDISIEEFPVEALANELIVDTNGAGDAFVGGFLAQLYQDKEIKDCVKAGIYLSREVVQRSGCTFPDKMEYSA